MKKLLLIVALLVFTTTVFCQDTLVHQTPKDYYLQKSKRQKTTAWILLSAGTAAIIGGVIGTADNFEIFSTSDAETGFIILTLAGVAADVASIPLFISAAKNKGRADVAVRAQKKYSLQANSIKVTPMPSLTLTIDF